jgi:MYXO-CTERM domain-containing protein
VAAGLVVATALGAVGTGAPRAAAGPAAPAAAAALRVSPASNLDPNGAFVVVSGTGYVPNAQLFVMQCRAASAEDHTCNSVGLRKVTTDGSGSFTANAMKVVANFGATDCLRTPCGIKTSAVADHADDRSMDRTATISFRAPAPPPTTAPPATVPPTAVPQTTAPTTAPPAVVTTTAPDDTATTTTTRPKATTTTEARAGDDPEGEGGDAEGEAGTELAGAKADGSDGDETASATSSSQLPSADGEGGSSPVVPIVIVVVLAAAGIGGFAAFRRRKAAPEA